MYVTSRRHNQDGRRQHARHDVGPEVVLHNLHRRGIEDCGKACGGHGFLVCSGLIEPSNTYLQSRTVKGDNQMLPQQVIKVLLKLVAAIGSDGDDNDAAAAAEYEETDMHL